MRKILVLSLALCIIYCLVNINVVSARSLMRNGSKRQQGRCPRNILCTDDAKCTQNNPILTCNCKLNFIKFKVLIKICFNN